MRQLIKEAIKERLLQYIKQKYEGTEAKSHLFIFRIIEIGESVGEIIYIHYELFSDYSRTFFIDEIERIQEYIEQELKTYFGIDPNYVEWRCSINDHHRMKKYKGKFKD